MKTKIQQAEADRLSTRLLLPVPASVFVNASKNESIATASNRSVVNSFLKDGEHCGWLTEKEKLLIVQRCAGLKGCAEVRAHANEIKTILVQVKTEQHRSFLRSQIEALQAQVEGVDHLATTLAEAAPASKVRAALVSHYLHNPMSVSGV